MNKFNKLMIGSFISVLAINVQAIPIEGNFSMGGGAFLLDAAGGVTNNASLAVAIDFNPNNFRVIAADGDFASNLHNLGRIKDLSFDVFASPVEDFWVMRGFSFDLTDVTRGVTNDPTSFLVLNGTGVISGSGYDDTAADWRYSSTTTGNGAFSWSASSSSQNIPEPTVLALLSVGLIGFALRKKL